MARAQKITSAQEQRDRLPEALPHIALNHGQAVWIMTELGFRGSASRSTFYEYLKSLRKFGVPFEHGEIGHAHRGLANYTYCHLMETALALTLRVYHVVPDSVLSEMILYRRGLYRHYRQAYVQRLEGMGMPITVETKGLPPIHMRGLFLDLQINFSGGRLVSFGPPKALTPFAALETFTEHDLAARALLPINLSVLSERVVTLALRAPEVGRRRGAHGEKLAVS